MTYKYLLLTLFLSVFLTACGGSSSSSSDPVDEPNGDTPDPGDDDDDNDGDDIANGDDDEATAAGLVAHFMFEENLEDAAGNFGEGQITGDAPDTEGGSITYAAGALDGSTAAVFDGTSGVYLGEGLIGPGDYTLSIWLHPDELAAFVPAFFGQSGPNSWVSLVPGGGPGDSDHTMLWAGDGDGTGWFDGTIGSQIPVGGWSHLVFTYSSGELNTYLNGELAVAHTGFPNVFSTDSASFHLGVNPFEADAPYTGLIDDLRIYDVALNADQVAALNTGEEIEINPDQISDDDGANGDDDGANGDDDGANGDDDDASGDDETGEATISGITGLSAHYAFSGDLSDSTGTHTTNAVTTAASPWETEQGNITYDGNGIGGGQALALDGTSGVRLPDGLIGSSAFTISLWVNPSELTNWTSALFAEEVNEGRWISLTPKTDNDEVMFTANYFDATNGEGRAVFSNTPESMGLTTNEWAHLAVTLNGSQIRLYINGVLRGSADNFHPLFEGSEHTIFALGVNPFPDAPFTGLMDQLRIYDRALEAEEIELLSTENQ